MAGAEVQHAGQVIYLYSLFFFSPARFKNDSLEREKKTEFF